MAPETPLPEAGAAQALVRRARAVLDGNWCDGYTKPAPRLYPHQWSWDSAFIAIGSAAYAPSRARAELAALFRGQWANGMLPHIVFHDPSGDYFPGPDFWETHRSAHAPRDVRTSGITNPPVHAIAALKLYQRDPDEQTANFLRALFPKICAFHRYLYEQRDPEREGLAYVRHPWESGLDNSPVWDAVLARLGPDVLPVPAYRRRDLDLVAAAQRPTARDYDRYVGLVALAKRLGYDETALARECPFAVQDPLFNSILCRANEALAELAELVGQDPGEAREWYAQTRTAVEEKLWDPAHSVYVAYDLAERGRLVAGSIAGFAPLFGGIPSQERAATLRTGLTAPGFWGRRGELYRVPSYDREGAAFDPRKYWRGPVWINTDWLLYQGLTRYGFAEQAAALRHDMVELVDRFGFSEYFGPFRRSEEGPTGGLGSPDFSWSAALLIDLLSEPVE